MNKESLVERVKIREQKYDTQREAAAAMNISPSELRRFLQGHIEPPKNMLSSLGLERVVTYREVRG